MAENNERASDKSPRGLIVFILAALFGAGATVISTGQFEVKLPDFRPPLSPADFKDLVPFGLSVILLGWITAMSYREYIRIGERLNTSNHAKDAVNGVLLLAITGAAIVSSVYADDSIFGLKTSEGYRIWFLIGLLATTPVFIPIVGDFIHLFGLVFVALAGIILRTIQNQQEFAGILCLLVGILLGTVLISIAKHVLQTLREY